ncbi:MAG: endolytic transglycosylase MltG [Lachnospiraceae bacterium]|jgi:cell division protein YceG involved in septum cleavage|nr:endolytic transglycosylase MltG [Lachnospiraceae bacterium]
MNKGVEIWKVVLGIAVRTLINVMFIYGLFQGFVYSYQFSYKLFADIPYRAGVHEVSSVSIESGSSAKDVSQTLADCGLVENKYMMLARLYLGKYNEKIQAGTYKLEPAMTPDEISRIICQINTGEEAQ